ncbi:MAG: hypothetical protein ABSB79_06640 [Syntrophales bacterium]|jgi:hypothetical protein
MTYYKNSGSWCHCERSEAIATVAYAPPRNDYKPIGRAISVDKLGVFHYMGNTWQACREGGYR